MITEGTALITSSKQRFTFDAVSQLDHDTSIALATIREWRNTFVSINRIPSEVLSLIPTHLPYKSDLLHASHVCRHWRRTFIQHAALWSRLDLVVSRNDYLVKTFLERAKGTPLDIRIGGSVHAEILALLSPLSQRVRSLDFVYGLWRDTQKLSDAVSGPLPLLHTLEINVSTPYRLGPETMDPPSLPLFSGAVNLKEFVFYSEGGPSFLDHFAFSNLTTFELSAMPDSEIFYAPQLLDFLEASPTLRTVHIKIEAEILPADIPPEEPIVLPNVETFSLSQTGFDYRIVTQISCPSARLTSFVREQHVVEWTSEEIFPISVSWNAIGPQYTAHPIDEVVLRITTDEDAILSCSISFLSPGPTTLELGCKLITGDEHYSESSASLEENHSEVLSHAFKAIRNHPLLSNVKRLRIRDRQLSYPFPRAMGIADEAALLFKSVGPLEELNLDVANLPLYLAPFLHLLEFVEMEQPVISLSIKELAISHSPAMDDKDESVIVRFAESQHMRGEPLERVILRMKDPPVRVAERLKPWVGTVDID